MVSKIDYDLKKVKLYKKSLEYMITHKDCLSPELSCLNCYFRNRLCSITTYKERILMSKKLLSLISIKNKFKYILKELRQ